MVEANAVDTRLRPIVAASQAEVCRLYAERDDAHLLYHSLDHTRDVVEAADRIASLSGYDDEKHEDLLVAAWWHDVGMLYCNDDPLGHERVSAERAAAFLRERDHPDKRIERVTRLILITDMAAEPTTELESAMRDADLSGLGRPEYRDRLKLLRKEWDAQGRLNVADRVQWLEENIGFFETHNFLTAAGQRLYGDQKGRNLAILEKRLKKRRKKKAKKAKSGSGEKSVIQSEKSAQMMLKTTLRNNIDLTSIADGKANIMLSINAVIISLGIPLLAAYIPEYTYLLVPGLFLLLTSILSITYATLATRPVKTSGKTDLAAIGNGKTNLFFFGNYYRMQLDEYKSGLREVFQDQALLDSAVMNDLYWLGVALGQKFNRLRICYAVFLGGMVLTILAFVATFYWAGPMTEGVELPPSVMMPAVDSLRR